MYTSSEQYATAAQFFENFQQFLAGEAPTADEIDLANRLLLAASRALDGWANTMDGFIAPATGTRRWYVGSGDRIQRIDRCVAVAEVAVKDAVTDADYTVWPATDWFVFNGNWRAPDVNNPPFEFLGIDINGDQSTFTRGHAPAPRLRVIGGRTPFVGFTVRVTGRWGIFAAITDVPNLREATIAQAARWWQRFKSGFADTLVNAEFGALAFRQKIDADIAMMLDEARLRRPSIG